MNSLNRDRFVRCYFCRQKNDARECRRVGLRWFCSTNCMERDREAARVKRGKAEGDRHGNWRGGREKINLKRLGSNLWRMLAAKIRRRDELTCQVCGAKWEKGSPHFPVDHIIPSVYIVAIWPGHEDDEENLLTACPSCHGRKVIAEINLQHGDVLGWQSSLTQIGYPAEPIQKAWEHFRSLPKV